MQCEECIHSSSDVQNNLSYVTRNDWESNIESPSAKAKESVDYHAQSWEESQES